MPERVVRQKPDPRVVEAKRVGKAATKLEVERTLRLGTGNDLPMPVTKANLRACLRPNPHKLTRRRELRGAIEYHDDTPFL